MAASCNAVSRFCSHYGCEEMCDLSFTHPIYTRTRTLVLIKIIISLEKHKLYPKANFTWVLKCIQRSWLIKEEFEKDFYSLLVTVSSSALTLSLQRLITVFTSIPSSLPFQFSPPRGTPTYFCLRAHCCVLRGQPCGLTSWCHAWSDKVQELRYLLR